MISYLRLVCLLQLVGVLVLSVVVLLTLQSGVHPLLFHFGPGEVQVRVCLLVSVQRPLRGSKSLLVLLLRLGEKRQGGLELGLDSGTLGQMLKEKEKVNLTLTFNRQNRQAYFSAIYEQLGENHGVTKFSAKGLFPLSFRAQKASRRVNGEDDKG